MQNVARELWARLGGDYPPHEVPFSLAGPEDGERNLALVLAYHGGGFAGWQLQPGKPTIQGAVEEALSTLCDHPVRVAASGRTDAGVHALGQVASFNTSSRLSLARMGRGLRSILPEGVLPRALGPAPPGFHARFDARAKTYDYYLWPGGGARPFLSGRLWALDQDMDPGPVAETLAALPGRRDLRALTSRGGDAEDTVRRVIAARLDADPGGPWRVRVTAEGFLRHVVRNLVGVLAQIGMGRLKPGALMEMIAAKRRIHSGPKAPPCGLYLAKVYYRRPPGGDMEDPR